MVLDESHIIFTEGDTGQQVVFSQEAEQVMEGVEDSAIVEEQVMQDVVEFVVMDNPISQS